MDEQTPTTPEASDLQEQCNSLRKQVQIILILVILVSATLGFFLQRQVKYISMELNGVRPMIDEYAKNQQPMMDDLVHRLYDYGRTHPDFAPIYTKYNLAQVGTQTNAPAKK